MLSDRPYMREDYQPERTPILVWLLCGLAGAYILELIIFSPWFKNSDALFAGVAVTIDGLKAWKIWTPLTHWLLHSPVNPFHVVMVLAALFMLGRALQPIIGAKRFLAIFFASIVVGALVWTAVNWTHGGALFGATAGVYGLLALYASLFPHQEINFLLFFFFPVTIKPKYLAVGLLALDLFAFAFYEARGSALPFGQLTYAPSAHLGGMLAGWLYYRFIHESNWGSARRAAGIELPRWLKRSKRLPATGGTPKAETTPASRSRDEIRAEVDRILDKINSHGFGALTPEEKRKLDDAKDLLSRR